MLNLKFPFMARLSVLLVICVYLTGCGSNPAKRELNPLLKRGEFYVAADSEGNTFYADFSDGILSVIGPGRTALEKYACDTPKLLATVFNAQEIIAAGQSVSGADGIALGNLYITDTEIIAFNFTDLNLIERLPLKKAGVTRVSDYDAFVDKQSMLWEAVNETAEYRVTIDAKENPVLYKDDRIVYFDGNQVYLKNVTGLNEEPVSFNAFYDRFVRDQERIEFLRRGNGLYGYTCLVFNDSLCFVSDSGHLLFGREEL